MKNNIKKIDQELLDLENSFIDLASSIAIMAITMTIEKSALRFHMPLHGLMLLTLGQVLLI